MKIYVYYNQDGLVKMFSLSALKEHGSLTQKRIDVTPEEHAYFNAGERVFYKSSKLILEEPEHKKRRRKLLEAIESAKDMSDVKKILTDLLTP